MRKSVLALAMLLAPAAVFTNALSGYFHDDFDVYLQRMGYNPLHPPQNEFPLGSLYDIDKNGNLDLVCPTTEAMAKRFTGPDSQNIERATSGSFSVIGDIADRLKATMGSEYSKLVKLSL